MKEFAKSTALNAMSSATGPEVTNVTIKNQGTETFELDLHLAGHRDFFEIPDKYRRVTLQPKGIMTIPARFRAGNKYRIMSLNAPYRAYVQLIDRKSKRVLRSIPVTAVGPGCASPRAKPCLNTPHTSPSQRLVRHNSPPSITRTVYRRGTHLVANMGEVDHSWRIDNIETEGDWVEVGYGWTEWVGVDLPSLESMSTHYWYPEALDRCEESYTTTVTDTYLYQLVAGNADGTARDHEWLYAKLYVGYHNACLPHSSSIDTSKVIFVRNCLEDIESWLRSDALVDLIRYADYWNTNVSSDPSASCNDRSFDEGGCLFDLGDPIDDESYLTARVAGGGLADDMLSAMQNLIIYTEPAHLPRTFRPDGHFNPDHSRLCDPGFGFTYSDDSRAPGSFGEWIAICYDSGANDMTIIHELFHYAAREHCESEDRAYLVSYLYDATQFGWVPSDEWPPWP